MFIMNKIVSQIIKMINFEKILKLFK